MISAIIPSMKSRTARRFVFTVLSMLFCLGYGTPSYAQVSFSFGAGSFSSPVGSQSLASWWTMTCASGFMAQWFGCSAVVTAVNGACGSSNGGTFATAPSSNLCSSGWPSAVSDLGYWWWQCTGSGGGTTADCSASKLVSAPTLTFWADSVNLAYNGSTTLRWTTTGTVTSCSATGGWSGSQSASGSYFTGALTSGTVYNLSCSGPGGSTGVHTVAVNVAPPVYVCTGSVPPNATMFLGDSTGLSADTAYSYSSSDTAVHCQYACNSGYGWNGSSCVSVPVINFTVNGSVGPVNLTQGQMKNFVWSVTNATACMALSNDGWSGSKAVPSGTQSLTANISSDHELSCTGPGGQSSAHIQVNVSCNPSTGAWGACDCSTEQKTRTHIEAACLSWTESTDCDSAEKNACRDFNWKEVRP